MSKKRTFSKEEKLLILREASEQGVKPTLEKHSIYPANRKVSGVYPRRRADQGQRVRNITKHGL